MFTLLFTLSGCTHEHEYTEEVVAPTAKELLEKNEEMKIICEILGESRINNIREHFFTNGTDLFVGFFADSGMFVYQCRMTFPVIFKCDSTLQNFEYIGCINNDDPMFFNNLKAVKNKPSATYKKLLLFFIII